jgi:hypothetical protein
MPSDTGSKSRVPVHSKNDYMFCNVCILSIVTDRRVENTWRSRRLLTGATEPGSFSGCKTEILPSMIGKETQ